MVDENDLSYLVDADTPEAELRLGMEEYARRLEEQKYNFYEPNGKTEEFIKNIGGGEYFIVLLSAANGVGKTACAANVVAHILFGAEDDEADWFKHKLFDPKNWPFPKRGRVASDPTNVTTNVIPALKDWLPVGRYTTKRGSKHFDQTWKTDTGFEFDVMTYEQDPKEFEGATLGWAWFDEPPTKAIFKATITRMRKGGIIFITETPIDDGAAWIYDELIAGKTVVEVNGEMVERKVAYTEAAMEDACKTHGVRGHLDHDQILKMSAQYSEDERQARVYGKFAHFVGRIFKKFDRKIHVVKPFQISNFNYVVYQFLDPHPRNPDAVLWVAVDKFGTHWVVDELFIKPEMGTADLAEKIKNKDTQYRIQQRWADPSAFIKDQHQEDGRQPKSLAEKLADHGLTYFEAPKFRTQADQAIQDALTYNRLATGEFIVKPKVFIFESCGRTIWEIENYRWDNWTGKAAERKDPKAKPVDKDDHQIENLGRALISKLSFVPLDPRGNIDLPAVPNSDPYD